MYVIKRNGKQEAVHFDKITARLHKLVYGLAVDERCHRNCQESNSGHL